MPNYPKIKEAFEDYASEYLRREVPVILIKDGQDHLVPKMVDLVSDQEQHGHLMEYYHRLLNLFHTSGDGIQ